MPKTTLYEESAVSLREKKERKWYTVFRTVALIFFVLAAATITFSISMIESVIENSDSVTVRVVNILLIVALDLSVLGIGLSAWFFKNRFNVSYDYIFVEDELRLTKVFNGRKRKFITKITVDRILQLGWEEKPSFETAVRGLQGRKPRYLTPNPEPAEGKEFIYILYQSEVGKSIYVLECRRMMLETLVFAAGRNKLERE